MVCLRPSRTAAGRSAVPVQMVDASAETRDEATSQGAVRTNARARRLVQGGSSAPAIACTMSPSVAGDGSRRSASRAAGAASDDEVRSDETPDPNDQSADEGSGDDDSTVG